jgi:hypothetical protein
MSLDALAKSLLDTNGQSTHRSEQQSTGNRLLYPAIVVNTNDYTEQNRITARIINLDQDENVAGGKDRDTTDDNLKMCIPLMPQFMFVKPQVGEMVFIIMENPRDESAARYYIGPIINTKTKLRFQSYADAVKIFDYTEFSVNAQTQKDPRISSLFPTDADVAIQGRNDSDLVLRPREVYLVAGKFKLNTLEANTDSPSYLQLIQRDNANPENFGLLTSYSQTNLVSTNINIYSPKGKFRGRELEAYEVNNDLKSFGDLAKSLHPTVFGDELVKLLDLIIRTMLTHIHTPQAPLTPNQFSTELTQYTVQGKLQNLLSQYVRIN